MQTLGSGKLIRASFGKVGRMDVQGFPLHNGERTPSSRVRATRRRVIYLVLRILFNIYSRAGTGMYTNPAVLSAPFARHGCCVDAKLRNGRIVLHVNVSERKLEWEWVQQRDDGHESGNVDHKR